MQLVVVVPFVATELTGRFRALYVEHSDLSDYSTGYVVPINGHSLDVGP